MLEDKDLLSIQEVRTKVEKAFAAWQKYRTYHAGAGGRHRGAHGCGGARQCQTPGRIGRRRDRLRQRQRQVHQEPADFRLAAAPHARHASTIGILRELPEEKIVEIGVPMGVVAAILPTTNPTSTAIIRR
jgi:acetaldehyde dehydrogenase (acetylating)